MSSCKQFGGEVHRTSTARDLIQIWWVFDVKNNEYKIKDVTTANLKILIKNKLFSQNPLKNNTRLCSKYTDDPDYKRKYKLYMAKPIKSELYTSKQEYHKFKKGKDYIVRPV